MDKEELSRFAKEIASRRRTNVEHICLSCGTNFRGYQKAKYCSNRCKQRAFVKTRKAKELGPKDT